MKTPQYYNLHSHTYRCGHAEGEDEEYLLHAKEAGFTEIGYADHVMLPGISQPGIRGEYEQVPEYVRSLNALKEKYRGDMGVHIGFEAEWLGDDFAPYYRELLDSGMVSFLLLGQHAYCENGSLHWYARLPHGVSLRRYRSDLIAGMDSGLFLYVCHPDTFVRWHGVWDEETRQTTIDICKAAVRNDIPLEINMSFGRINLAKIQQPDCLEYPCPMFWDIAAEMGVKCVFGVDAHDPNDYQTTPYEHFLAFAKAHHLNLLSESPLKKK